MKTRTLKIESKLIEISEELRKKGYEVDKYTGQKQLQTDGIRITKQGPYSAQENMIESKWLCGVILNFDIDNKGQRDLVLNLREGTPYSEELFRVIRGYLQY